MKTAVHVVDQRSGRHAAAIGTGPHDRADPGTWTPSWHNSPRSMAQRKRLAATLGSAARQRGNGLVVQRFPIRVEVQDQDAEETVIDEADFWLLIEKHREDKALLERVLSRLSANDFPIHVAALNELIAHEPAKPNKYTSGKNAHLKPKDPRPARIADLQRAVPQWRLECCFNELRRNADFNALVGRVEEKLQREVSVQVCDEPIASCTPTQALIEIPRDDVQGALPRVRFNLVFELHNLLRWERDQQPGDAGYALAAEWDEWRSAFLTLCGIATMREASAGLEIDTQELGFGPGGAWNRFRGYLLQMVGKKHTAQYDPASTKEAWPGWDLLKQAEADHEVDLCIREHEDRAAPRPEDLPERNPFRLK